MAELRINTTGKLSLFDADDSHAASIVAGTVTANENVMSLATAGVTFNVPTITLGDATGDSVTFNAATAPTPNTLGLAFTGTGGIKVPEGTTGERPTVQQGMLRYNSDTDEFEGYADSSWGAIGGGASAGGAIYENTQTIGENYTMTSGTNGHSVGPITIDSSYAVTIPAGSHWLISA